MQFLLVFIHVVAAVLLILIILLQQGKGGGLAGLFGGGSGMEDVLSSPSGNVFLKKATVTLAVIFFLTSLILAVRTSREGTKSLFQKRAPVGVPK
jgi:preprotein translocase subunit SecG